MTDLTVRKYAVTRRRAFTASFVPLAGGVALAACGTSGGSAPAQTKEVAGVVQPLVRGNGLERDLNYKAFDLFKQQHPKITVDAIDVGGDNYDDKTQALLAAGTPPSMWFAGGNVGYRHWAAKGVIQNLDPLIARDKYDLKPFYESYLPYHKFGGKYMALPSNYVAWVLFYNKSLFDAAGVKYPTKDWADKSWTWDKLLDVAKQLTKTEGGKVTQLGIGGVGAAPRFTAMLMGGDWFSDDGYDTGWIKKFNGTSPEVVDAYQFQQDLAYKHHVQPTPQDLKDLGVSNTINAFAAGKIAMHVDTITRFPTLAKAQGLKWGMSSIPIGAGKPRRTLIWADYWTFFTGQKSVDATWELLKFLCGPDAQKIYPIGLGSISSLKSLAPLWTENNQRDLGFAGDELKVAAQAVEVEHVSADNFTINWPELWDALKDPVADVLANKVPAKQALTSVAPAAEAAIQKSLPK